VKRRPRRRAGRLIRLAALGFLAAIPGCFGGGGTETEHGVVFGRLVLAGNQPAKTGVITVRPVDYLTDPVISERNDSTLKLAYADNQGRYEVRDLPPGTYRIEMSYARGEGELFGVVRDTVVEVSREGVDMGRDSLKAFGTVTGAILPDSDSQASGFVQVYGMERFRVTDAQGNLSASAACNPSAAKRSCR
jgi:hypothetical protein